MFYFLSTVDKLNNLTLAPGKDREIWLQGFNAVTRICQVTALKSFPRARFHSLYWKSVFDCFSFISYEFVFIVIEKYKC